LLGVDGAKGQACLVDVKEAVTALAPRYPKKKMPKDNAERVLTGARHLSPSLGERMLATRLHDKPVFLRELLPQDLKLEIEELTPDEATRTARYLAKVVGKAHARQMDHKQRAAWLAKLTTKRTKTLDAPSWLWSSVVEQLITIHEGAYLDHCRKHITT
jgi:uncharacterized protein (DUF2252 family)